MLAVAVLGALIALATAGCSDPEPASGGRGDGGATGAVDAQGDAAQTDTQVRGVDSAAPGGPLTFTDVTEAAGIRFKHDSGAFGKKYLPETMGSGCAFIDYDADGWQDILLVNSTGWPERKGARSTSALYRNNHDGTFTDVTAAAGLAAPMYGLGCAVGDYDGDGLDDVYITTLGLNHLFRNLGGGRFADVTSKAGVGDQGFSTSAAWLDFDRDGALDLFVCNYVDWSVAGDIRCSLDGKTKSYCTPELYKGQSPTLYRNRGNGTFEDVTRKSKLFDPGCKALGVAVIDYDGDGRPDLFVANDTQPNRLYRNNGDGTFGDVAVEAGVAFSQDGRPRAGMGCDAGDFNGSGREGLVLGNFSKEMMSLYTNDGSGLFTDEAPSTVVGRSSAPYLTFAAFFFDYDLDGQLDVFASNGHVSDDIAVVQPQTTYAQPALVFHNVGGGKFEDASARLGSAIQKPVVGRGAAYGDIDNDGDLDLVLMENNGPARVLRNDGGNRNNVLRMRLIGSSSNRDAIGAIVTVKTSSGLTVRRSVKSGSSYCSQSELPLTFGLGQNDKAASVEIRWPSGRAETYNDMPANLALVVQEAGGVLSGEPIKR
ncbi:MAG TPA: CRTAC1 family protein [Blastocatellia bacterium]|nr:CRTAC1 family protein [Blastocatellia bacterium]